MQRYRYYERVREEPGARVDATARLKLTNAIHLRRGRCRTGFVCAPTIN
jgi:hypothetical protein